MEVFFCLKVPEYRRDSGFSTMESSIEKSPFFLSFFKKRIEKWGKEDFTKDRFYIKFIKKNPKWLR